MALALPRRPDLLESRVPHLSGDRLDADLEAAEHHALSLPHLGCHLIQGLGLGAVHQRQHRAHCGREVLRTASNATNSVLRMPDQKKPAAPSTSPGAAGRGQSPKREP